VHILIIEDNPGDARLMQDALLPGSISMHVTVCMDGERALAWLRGEAAGSVYGQPDLIFLDWYLPKKNGREVLTELKSDAALRHIPVMIVSGGTLNVSEPQLRALGAEGVVIKPMNPDDYLALIHDIAVRWTTRTPGR
jgi:chemotaxis family two-component system response regulator Rcp1